MELGRIFEKSKFQDLDWYGEGIGKSYLQP